MISHEQQEGAADYDGWYKQTENLGHGVSHNPGCPPPQLLPKVAWLEAQCV